MNFSNDVLLILLLSILSTPEGDDGEVEFANNTNFLLLLLLVLQSSRGVDSINSCLCRNGLNCNGCNTCNSCNDCNGNNCNRCNRLLG